MATITASFLTRSAFRRASVVKPVWNRFVSVRLATTYFTPAHEYISVSDGVGTCGITDFAQSALGDIVFVDLPECGDEFDKGESFGSVESVKAASDIYAPVKGTVTEINEALVDTPELVNSDPEGNAWFVKLAISDESELESLMDAEAYKAHCDKEAH